MVMDKDGTRQVTEHTGGAVRPRCGFGSRREGGTAPSGDRCFVHPCGYAVRADRPEPEDDGGGAGLCLLRQNACPERRAGEALPINPKRPYKRRRKK